jgi:hypothetical protein
VLLVLERMMMMMLWLLWQESADSRPWTRALFIPAEDPIHFCPHDPILMQVLIQAMARSEANETRLCPLGPLDDSV